MDRWLACEVELSSTGDCGDENNLYEHHLRRSAMYDVKTQFFPQFLTFKMAEESLAREVYCRFDTKSFRYR